MALTFLKLLFRKLKKLLIILFIGQFAYIILLKWVDPPITITQFTNWVEGHGLKRDYIDYDEMSPNIKLAVMASEDQLFPDHNGFDVESIKKAWSEKNKKRKRVRGASTISQQVAKNVFLWQGRSWIRKGLEVYFTFMIELIWGKERILEMYLNVAEMGKGIFGVEAASKSYFKKPAKKLTRAEAAMIAGCLPNPKKFRVQPPSNYISRRYPQIMVQMNNIEPDEDIQKLLQTSTKK
ncbi:MAG: monofunctional biosynthetic peptidoglycan transglycosylase [Bacteroidota bacterium]|jgi:monofunctional biosynthetic peptidoglycan transglycosylase|nr:monofunctional biosynthetic peptidoglycan transglycosylase [Cytophagales bacterium]MCE2958841.1 monofunctional biosynthetic peptidoglycan transglycosylase [Flammeovirgaceae bacterium]MCZ8069455.1 monofunctional biosynthetic peptidoglycan transglycosylase [Cytophagales bacterium]